MDIKKRIKELIKIIDEANHEYYGLDNPSLTDQEYDRYMQELFNLEAKYPNYVLSTSPTQKVGSRASAKYLKVSHKIPMLSLGNIFNETDVRKFDARLKEKKITSGYVCELKIDGLAISLIYEQGLFIRAVTRGDGLVGEDITVNVRMIKSIPLKIKEKIDIEVRGEIFIPKKVFIKLNQNRYKEGLKPFMNARNAASGTVRQLDSKVVLKRQLDCFVYHLANAMNYGMTKHSQSLEYLKELGFKLEPNSKYINKIDDVLTFIDFYTNHRQTLDYDIDGIVIKVDNLLDQQQLGATDRQPKWATAYKFPAKEATTRLKDIVFTVGRTGQVTPNAVLEPVIIQGSLIRRASLHNENIIKEKDIKIGDIVIVRKAGEVIPEVVKAVKERRRGKEKEFKMPKDCPICNTLLVKSNSGYFCYNKNCEARKIEGLVHFVSRKAMNIEGLGEKIIEDFYNLGFLKTLPDIYLLYQHQEELKELEGFGNKSIDKLLINIENSKQNSLDKLLFALGISQVGSKIAKVLAAKYQTLDNLSQASIKELMMNNDIGPIISQNLINYFSNLDNQKMITDLKKLGINMKYIVKNQIFNPHIDGKTFVITGTLSIPRKELITIIENHNGQVSENVSFKTDIVIVGKNPGSKYIKALKIGISIWNEDKLKDILE